MNVVKFWRRIETDARDSQDGARQFTRRQAGRHSWSDQRLPESSTIVDYIECLMTVEVETDEMSVRVSRDESKERERP